jgi:hypothetical protein
MKLQNIIVNYSPQRIKFLNKLLGFTLMLICHQAVSATLPKDPILSYYFPRAIGETDTTNTFSAANIIGAAPEAWTDSLRNYWRSKGKIILVRSKFKYENTYTQNKLNSILEENLSLYDGLTIDELVAHQMDSNQINTLMNAIKYIKTKYPDKLVIVYSATSWDAKKPLLVSCMKSLESYADLLVEEIYLKESYGIENKWRYPYLNTRIKALKKCGSKNVLKKTMIILGVYSVCFDKKGESIGKHIKAQMQYIKNDPLLSQTQGIGIYAPLYASPDELKKINKAVKNIILSDTHKQPK